MLHLIAALALAGGHQGCAPLACGDHRCALPSEVLLALDRVDDAVAHQAQQLDPRHQADLKNDADMGQRYAAEVEKQLKLSKNEAMIARVTRIGNEFAAIANANRVQVSWGDARLNPFQYTFRVVEGEDVNAFSIPGGYIYFYEGLLRMVESDDELAGVMAHEVSHASFRHLATLQREQSRLDAITLPLILVTLLSGRADLAPVLTTSSLLNQAIGSGWSQKAETAADFGAFQYMMLSRYNPVGILTFLERLNYQERHRPDIELGIYRTHPPSRERVEAIREMLGGAKVPIRRSAVTTSLRVQVKPADNGSVDLTFIGQLIHRFAGEMALERANEAAERLDSFFDGTPDLFMAQLRGQRITDYRGRTLFEVHSPDATALKKEVKDASDDALRNVKRALFNLAFRNGS